MNVLHLSCQHFTSGIGRYSFELAHGMVRKNPETRLRKVWKAGHADTVYHDQHSWIEPVLYRSFRNLHPYVLPLYLRRAIPKSGFDLVHAHWFLSGAAVSMQSRLPAVVTLHDVSLLHIPEKDWMYTAYYRSILGRLKRLKIPVITVSKTARLDAITYGGFPEEQVHAVWNGIAHDQFRFKEARDLDGFQVIYSGGLGKRKNLELLLKAWQTIERLFPEAHLRIAGAWPERTHYPALARELGLQRVTFTGFIPDDQMEAFYQSAHLMVYTSTYEGFGFAPLEAMACGTPVITTNGGALKETAVPGALETTYDEEDLVKQIIRVMDSPDLRTTLQQKGVNWAQQFTWEKTIEKTETVYGVAG